MEYCITIAVLFVMAVYFFVSPLYEQVKVVALGDISGFRTRASIEEGKICPIIDLTKTIEPGAKLRVRLYPNDFYLYIHDREKIMVRTYHGLQVMETKEYMDVEVF